MIHHRTDILWLLLLTVVCSPVLAVAWVLFWLDRRKA
jgi:nitrate reductase NapE component